MTETKVPIVIVLNVVLFSFPKIRLYELLPAEEFFLSSSFRLQIFLASSSETLFVSDSDDETVSWSFSFFLVSFFIFRFVVSGGGGCGRFFFFRQTFFSLLF